MFRYFWLLKKYICSMKSKCIKKGFFRWHADSYCPNYHIHSNGRRGKIRGWTRYSVTPSCRLGRWAHFIMLKKLSVYLWHSSKISVRFILLTSDLFDVLGLFGFLVLGFLQIPFYFIHAGPPVTQNVGDRLEDAIDAFVQIGHSWQLALAVLGKKIMLI